MLRVIIFTPYHFFIYRGGDILLLLTDLTKNNFPKSFTALVQRERMGIVFRPIGPRWLLAPEVRRVGDLNYPRRIRPGVVARP